jgi:hypothetical protein
MLRLALIVLLAEAVTPRSSSPDIVTSDHIREDPVAGKKAYEEFLIQLKREDEENQLRFDRDHMRDHRAVLALFRKARARYDRARTKRAVDGAHEAAHEIAVDIRHRMEQIDRWRNNAKVFADYDALLKLIEDDYPPALVASFNGEPEQLAGVRTAFDEHMKTVRQWLAQAVKQGDEE